jgi:hypothetical protein
MIHIARGKLKIAETVYITCRITNLNEFISSSGDSEIVVDDGGEYNSSQVIVKKSDVEWLSISCIG